MPNFSRNILSSRAVNYDVINLCDARQSPGSISGSRTFEKPVYVDKVYMSWFRSYSDYKATVTVKITLEDDTQRTIYSVSNSAVVGGENAVLNVNDKIKAISFEMFSGSVGGNGIGYQLTFVAQVHAPGDKFYVVKKGEFVVSNAFKMTSNGGGSASIVKSSGYYELRSPDGGSNSIFGMQNPLNQSGFSKLCIRASLSSGSGHGGLNNYNLLSGQFRQGNNAIVLAADKDVIDQTNLFRVHYATLYIYDMWLEK